MADGVVNLQVNAIGNFSNVIGEVNKFRSQLQNLKLPDKLTAKLEKGFDNVESKVSHFQSLLNKGITTKGDFSRLISSARAADKALVDLKEDVKTIGNKDLHIAVANSAEIQKAEQALNKLINAGDKLKNFGTAKGTGFISDSEVAKIQKLANTSTGLKKKFQDVTNAFQTGNIEQASAAIEKLIAHVQRYQTQMNNSKSTPGKGDEVLKWANGVKQELNSMVSEVERARVSFNQLQSNKFDQMKNSINGIATGLGNATNAARNFINSETEAASRMNQLNDQVSHLRTQANYFFGLQNMGRLIARGIREAAESVKDLDKAMTETAVVTDFSVSDMWNMLPEYTKLANELGATTQGAYETMTLYFQQGLDKQATFEIGEETMKMARIAGLDYAQTTNMMTAALRGFNMELNQTSAKRVNDVYSELAAITASDTRELGLAMERTASIAHSAGMDFGNTTAFLAQMIETTREAPENLGTAMKTIIARFQELKENPYQISEVEGEEVDFNRVDKALKTIGVDLMDNKDKFRDLDDVFMDISERWDGLSQTQQRYVATIAAGARQQSRFLAMVQNYDRLKQLTEAAANSEGASDVQFNKTLESYEAKVNKLKNAWQAFTMSLANNQAVKLGVDALKNIITFGNKIIQVFGNVGAKFGEVGKGLGEMTAAFGLGALGFKGLKGGANLGLKLLGGMTVKGATMGGGMFPSSAKTREMFGLASKISNPIVAAINNLTSVVSGKSSQNIEPDFRSDIVKERRGNLYAKVREKTVEDRLAPPSKEGSSGSIYQKKGYKYFSAADVQKEFKDLSVLEQQQIYRSVPSIRGALQKGYISAYNDLNLDKAGKAALQEHFKKIDNAVKSGQISANDAFKHLYNPASLANVLSESAPEVAKQLNQEINDKFKSMTFDDKKGAFNRARAEADKKQLKGQERKQFIRQQITGEAFGLDAKQTAQLGKVSGAMTAISSKAATAGQSVMGLGMALDAVGLHGAGGALMTVGNGLIGIGMAAEGAVSGVQALGTALKTLSAINPVILAASGIAAAGAVVVGGVMAYNKKMVDDTRKAGERVVDTYTKIKEKTTTQLDNLKKYNENWDLWSGGVDENGNNVSLGTEEYQEYLKAVKDITSAHPELIKGYNAIGNAIVDNNTVLKQAVDLTKKDEKDAFDAYKKGYDEIVAKQKTYKRWTNAMGGSGENTRNLSASANAKGATGQRVNTTTSKSMVDEADAVVESINKIKGGSEVLSQFGVEIDSTGKLTERGLATLRTHLGDITNAVKDLDVAPDEAGQKALDNMTEKANAYAKTVQGLEKVSKDTYDWGWEYASSKGYDKIEGGLVVPFQTAIERLAEKGLGQKEFESEIDKVGQKYQDLGGHLTEFQQIQKDVGEAQKELGESADFDAYTDSVEVATSQMDGWIAELKSSTDEADHILAEYLTNQKEMMLDYSKQAEIDLSTGLNQDQALFKSSADASKRYEAAKGEITDYVSGLNSMKAILDDAMTDQNLEGNGSLAFEQASISVLGENFVDKNIDDIDKIKGRMEEYQGWLQDSEGNARSLEDTYTSFWDHITQKAMESPDKTIEGIDGKLSDFFVKTEDGFEINAEKWSKLTDEQMGYLAEQGFDMAADFMSSMLNVGRQLGYYSAANIDMVRQGLIEQNGQGSAVSESGETVYKRQSDLEEESRLAQNSKQETQQIIEEAGKAGIELIGDVSQMTGKSIKTMMTDLGVSGKKTGEDFGINFVKQFEGLNYSKEETSQAIDKALASNDFTDTEKGSLRETQANLSTVWDKIIDNKALGLEDDKSIEESIEGHTASIESMLGQQLAQEGQLSKEAYGYDNNNLNAGLGYDALHTVLGNKGKDTLAQFFASGTDAAGNKLSNEQYTAQLDQLQRLRQQYAEQEALMRTNAQNTSGDDANWWTAQANYAQQATKYLDDYISKGQQAHEEKLQQNEEENQSNNEKTTNKTENDKKEADSTKQLSEEEANAKLQELANKPLEEGESLEDRKQKFLEEADALGVTGERLQALQNQAANFSSLGGLAGSLGDTQKVTLFAKGFDDLINSANLTDDQITQLGTTLNSMSPDQLNNLTKADFGQLLGNLNLTESQIEQLKAANPEIKFETDTTEVDKVEEKAEEPTKKEHKITYKTEVTPQTNVENKGKQQVQQQTQQQTQQSVTNNTITLNSTIANPNEPKEKIDAAMPKKYTKTVTASITMNASVKTGNLKTQMQNAANSASSGLKVKAATTSTVKTKIDNSAQKQINNIKRNGAVTIKTKADNAAQKAINAIKGKTVTVTISPTFSGNWTKTATINVNTNKTHTGGLITPGGPIYRARGGLASNPMFKREGTDTIPAMLTPGEYVENRDAVKYFGIDFMRRINHKDLQGALQSFGSAARGRGGRLGSNGKGGLTLTGEEGFEVAWIPSENRSMILGANGPQMVDLPSDAVIWNNKQSKKIVRQKAISAGSMRSGGNPNSSKTTKPTKPTKGGTDTKKKGGDDSKGGNDKKSTKKKKEETRELIKQGKISSFIFNLEQQIAQVKIRQEKAQKELNKELERTTATLQSAAKYGKEDLMRLKQLSNLNKKLVSYYNKQLSIKNSDGKASKTLVKWENKTQKRTKKNGKWSKWKDSSTKKHSENINIGRYIKYDKTTGSYIVDYAKINKEIGQDHKNNKTGKTIKGDAAKAKAVKEAAEKAISENTSKRDSAQAAWDDAQDKITEVGKQLYDTFHGWENELTKIYDLTKKIEDVEKHTSRLKAAQELQEARLASGARGNTATSDFIENTLKYFRAELTSTTDEFNARTKIIDEQRIEVVRAISSKNELAEYENALRAITAAKNSKNATALAEAQTRRDEALQKLQAIRVAQNYYSVTLGNDGTILNENFDATKLASDVNAGKISEAQYTAIKEYVEGIREQSQTLNDLLEEQTSSLKDLYDSLGDLKEQYADRAEELLESVENADEENLDKLEKLNDALSDALKDLLDEVKKRLEQRRQQEDNLEKEENISDKQRRLAALRADNSGANAKEIKQLEQEIANLQKEYGRTLEDQALDRLQDQADKAAEQRERQIQILNAQLDYAKSTGGNRLRVEALLADPEGNKEEIKELWRQNKKYDEQLSPRKEVLDTEFEQFFANISKNGLQAKIDSTEETIEKTNNILTDIQTDIKALMTDLNAPRTSSGQSTGGQTAATMKANGMDVKSTIRALTQKGVTGAALKTQLRKAGFSAKDYKDSGYNAKDAAAYGGFNVKQLKKGGYTAKQLRDAKIGGLKQYKEAGYTAKDLKAAGYSAKALRSQGFNIKQLKAAGYTAEQMRQAGYTAQALRGYGYTQKQIMSAKYTTGQLLTAGYTGAQIQSTKKTSTVAIQKAISSNIKNRNVTQSDLAGTKATIDINGKNKGGVKAAVVGKSGTAAVTRQGSTLYIQAMKGGKTSGNVGKVPIGSLKTSHFKNYSAQATQALVYAIMHQEPGSKINKDIQALVKKAKLVGRTYKLKNKISGSIDGNGNIHYNNGISGVKVWNTSKGKLIEHKFSKDKKSAFYKNRTNKNVGREYRQVNDARIKENKKRKKGNKLSVYKTGGLADYTGPAWLDGTPSKPELVLNSQDTKNFLALKDVLGKAVGSTQSVTNSNETAMYEININVDHINNDYDVDKIAERIKKDIVKDAGYRNVTQVRHFR